MPKESRSEILGEDRVQPLCEEGKEEGDDGWARAVSGRAQRARALRLTCGPGSGLRRVPRLR